MLWSGGSCVSVKKYRISVGFFDARCQSLFLRDTAAMMHEPSLLCLHLGVSEWEDPLRRGFARKRLTLKVCPFRLRRLSVVTNWPFALRQAGRFISFPVDSGNGG